MYLQYILCRVELYKQFSDSKNRLWIKVLSSVDIEPLY